MAEMAILPVLARRAEIEATIRAHRVVVLTGETGSGKTTQLPQIVWGMNAPPPPLAKPRGTSPAGSGGGVAHTQPRRLAARAVSARIAEEMGVRLGGLVGYKVRFDERTSRETGITVMTDGMLLAEHAGPKAQIFYADAEQSEFFCDTVEMFSVLRKPEQVRKVNAVFVQDMGAADWAHPRGHWIDARSAYYVVGSSQRGSMGPTIGSFANEAQARAFAEKFGGQVHPFDDVTADMAVLDGGVLHDAPM